MTAIQAYNTPAVGIFHSKKREKGITLIMVLIFMVTLSLVTAVAMRGVITGDRVVANELDKVLAFQSAESAAREAIAAISAIPPTHTVHFGVAGAAPHPQGGNAEFWRTSSSLTLANCNITTDTTKRFDWSLPGCSTAASSTYVDTTRYTKAVAPRYVIECLPNGTAPSSSTTEFWYRITARASGATNEADVILQVMFPKTVAGASQICS